MKILIKHYLPALAVIILMVGCKKFVEISAPSTQLVTTSVFSDNTSANAAQLAVYGQTVSFPSRVSRYMALSSDEMRTYSANLTDNHLYTNSLIAATDGSGISEWSDAYKLIYQENAIIENLGSSTVIDDATKKQLTAEARFMRAFRYFYLVNLYGNVPLILSTNFQANSRLSRTSKSDVYNQIISDLIAARNALSADYIDASNVTITSERVRPTSYVATALLARVYLYMGDWANAEKYSSLLIDNNGGRFVLLNDLTKVFLANSPEAIWQLQVPATQASTAEGRILIPKGIPSTANSANVLSDSQINAFEPGDARQTQWTNIITDGSTIWYYCYKYRAGSTATGPSPEYSMVLRLAEQYLIRAEARAQIGTDLNGAIIDLNVIRSRAGLPNLTATLTKTQILAAVAQERRAELFFEGHRWLDLKRVGTVDAVMAAATALKGGIWNTQQQLYPIPLKDIQGAPNLTQTPGY